MRIRTMLPGILCSAVLGTALGCSGQPTAPSTLVSPSTVGVASTAPGGSQQTAVSASRFGDRTPGVVYVTSQGLYYDTFVVKDPLPMNGRFQLSQTAKQSSVPANRGIWADGGGKTRMKTACRTQRTTSSSVHYCRRDGRPRRPDVLGARHALFALSTSSKQADEDTLYAAWTVAAIAV